MKSIIIVPRDNTPGKSDATGAFKPEGKRLRKFLRTIWPNDVVDYIEIPTRGVPYSERQLAVSEALSPSYDGVFFLCHGFPTGFQFGFRGPSGVQRFADLLGKKCPSVEMITFFSCLMGKNNDNYLLRLFDAVDGRTTAPDFQVFGHYSAGHTTMNKDIKIYSRGFLPFIWSRSPVEGYNELVSPRSSRDLDRQMKNPDSDFRFAVAFLVRVLKRFSLTKGLKPTEV